MNSASSMAVSMRRANSTQHGVVAVDVQMTLTLAASDRAMMIKPGTDGALALAVAHVILTEGLWEKSFVGDFKDGVNHFKTGEKLDESSFKEKWVKGLIQWWNTELKDRTPQWAAGVTTLTAQPLTA